MPNQRDVSKHYTHGNLVATIRSGLGSLGKTVNSVTVDDLAPVDEFHIGGRQASEDFLSQLNLAPENHVLDVGCGLGGAAGFVASRYGCQVTGIDLTPEYVETAKVVCGWVGLDSRISLHQGSALAMPRNRDRVVDEAGGEDHGQVGSLVEAQRDLAFGDGDGGRYVDEVTEDLLRLSVIVSAHAVGYEAIDS